jgi:glycosyltransferase involved in cell wall biosynthesis
LLAISKPLLVVSLSNRAGGAEQCLQMIANAACAKQLFLLKAEVNTLPKLNYSDSDFVSKKSLIFGYIYIICKLVKYRKGYVILSSAVYLNAYLGFLKRIGFLKSEVVVRESTTVFSRFKGLKKLSYVLAYKLGYPAIKLIICQTEFMRAQFIKYNSFIPASRVITLANPMDLKAIKGDALKGEMPFNFEFICAAGRLIPIKGFSILINAFKPIVEKRKDLKLVILGEGPERDNLQKQIHQLGLEGSVILMGHVANPYVYFKYAKVCVTSSIEEGFPNTLLQMMALNTSVVSTLCAGGIAEIPSILKVEIGNIPALQDAISTCLEMQKPQDRRLLDGYLAGRDPQSFVNHLMKQVENLKKDLYNPSIFSLKNTLGKVLK